MQQVFLGNTVQDYLWTIGIIVLVLLLNKIVSRLLASLVCKLLKKKWKAFDERTFIDLIVQPLSVFVIITLFIIAFYRLRFPEELNIVIYKYSLRQIFLSVAIIIQVAAFTWLLLRMIDFIAFVLQRRADLSADQADNQLVVFFRDLVKVILGIMGLLMILQFAFSYNISSLLTGLSIVGAAVALSLRESLENLIASFVIFFDKPFTTGDNVKVQSVTGVVEKIGLRSTRIRSDQKTFVSVPNKQMVDSILDNISLRTQQRNELLLQVNLQTPSSKLEALISELKRYLATIDKLDLYNVFFVDINVQAYAIMIEFFVPAAHLAQFNSIRQQVNLFALKTIENLEIKIAGVDKEIVTK